MTRGSRLAVSRNGRGHFPLRNGPLRNSELDAAPPARLFCRMSETGFDGEPARIARRLLRSEQRGTLATSMRGAPYASLVLITADLDASPLLLLSDLAQHSRNIAFDPR